MYLDRFRASDVIEYLGGITDTARLLGVTVSAVTQWRTKGTFPVSRALVLAKHTGLSPEWFHNPWAEIAEADVQYGTIEDLREHVKAVRAVR